jgi:hypothetical protein
MRRIFMIFAAMLMPIAGLTLAFGTGVASAGTGKITCTNVTGTVTGTITISGCTGGNTGGASVPQNTLNLETGGTTTWVSGSTTTTGAPTTTIVKATKCPGYVKPPKGTSPPEPSALAVAGTVTADTGDGMLLPATQTGEVCVGTDGNTITALKPFVFAWTSSALTCTTINGSVGTNSIVISGCTGGHTGGSSMSVPATALAAGGTIPWTSGGSTTITAPTLSSAVGKACPGYVKPAKGTNPAEPTLEKFSATVTADSGDGLKLPGSAKGSVCVGTDGTITAASPLAAK